MKIALLITTFPCIDLHRAMGETVEAVATIIRAAAMGETEEEEATEGRYVCVLLNILISGNDLSMVPEDSTCMCLICYTNVRFPYLLPFIRVATEEVATTVVTAADIKVVRGTVAEAERPRYVTSVSASSKQVEFHKEPVHKKDQNVSLYKPSIQIFPQALSVWRRTKSERIPEKLVSVVAIISPRRSRTSFFTYAVVDICVHVLLRPGLWLRRPTGLRLRVHWPAEWLWLWEQRARSELVLWRLQPARVRAESANLNSDSPGIPNERERWLLAAGGCDSATRVRYADCWIQPRLQSTTGEGCEKSLGEFQAMRFYSTPRRIPAVFADCTDVLIP